MPPARTVARTGGLPKRQTMVKPNFQMEKWKLASAFWMSKETEMLIEMLMSMSGSGQGRR